ncbi:hypothetical protein CANINC_002180 [Pichia inconspicua]|uniref:Amino acid permease/ SLC12A domain-containing protein n=1 Tax=Pichia inconspicua TaxID=52247 RepID=A0A4T0X203_9ASCO|nr:hypothetical protein CANINC_002180 [[Candida] inconspicua]
MSLFNEKLEIISTHTDTESSSEISDNVMDPKPEKWYSKFNFIANKVEMESHTERKLSQRHIDMISIGGSIGTSLFVTIGSALMNGGCGNLLIAFTIHGLLVIYPLTLSIGELVCYLPVDSPFITHAGRFVDPAFEVVCGYNFWIMVSLFIPFEITSLNSMIHFWSDNYSPVAVFLPQIAAYILLNVFAVNWYGESEFCLSIGKLILAVGLLLFTFVTMVGGNPQHHAFGFTNFKGIHNAFPDYLGSGGSAFWAAYLKAIFVEAAPEYLGMIAGEAKNPRKSLPRAFRSVIYRLSVFYVLGALAVGVLLKHDDPTLVKAVTEGAAGANVSPYVIAMQNMNIKVLPNIVNALCITSTFSAGNSFVYCSSRAIFAMAKRGKAPRFFTICTKNGVPIAGVVCAIGFSCLSLLQLGKTAGVALDWMINLCTGCQIMNYFFMSVTYLFFYRACKTQNVDRTTMPLQSWCTKLQPYPAIFCFIATGVSIIFLGTSAFLPSFDVDSFLYYYLMVFVNLTVFVCYKFFFKTMTVKPEDADLFSGLAEIDEHERKLFASQPTPSHFMTRWNNISAWIF